jgi:hypothetical protein
MSGVDDPMENKAVLLLVKVLLLPELSIHPAFLAAATCSGVVLAFGVATIPFFMSVVMIFIFTNQ